MIKSLLKTASRHESCQLKDPDGQPRSELPLPEDLKEFFEVAGGMKLFAGADYPFEIVSPNEFTKSNPVICDVNGEDDISFHWYIVAKEPPQYISIDLHPDRLGRCYDSFWDCHAVAGACAIVATSFTALLDQLLQAQGRELFWKQPDFIVLGDAYDE